MLRVLHVAYLKTFLWNPRGHSVFRDCSFNQFCVEKLAELALNVRVAYNSDSIWISIIMFQISTLETKKQEKVSVVFDEGLQIFVSSEKCIWDSLFKVSINTWQN